MLLFKYRGSKQRMTGACEVSFHASGQAALLHVIPITVAPDTMRDMVGWVLDSCIGEEQVGGYVTRHINRTSEWLADPNVEILDWNNLRKKGFFFEKSVI